MFLQRLYGHSDWDVSREDEKLCFDREHEIGHSELIAPSWACPWGKEDSTCPLRVIIPNPCTACARNFHKYHFAGSFQWSCRISEINPILQMRIRKVVSLEFPGYFGGLSVNQALRCQAWEEFCHIMTVFPKWYGLSGSMRSLIKNQHVAHQESLQVFYRMLCITKKS